MSKNRFLSTAGLIGGLLSAAPALAQADTARTDRAPDDAGLGEITVTAQKRAQNIQQVPIAILAATGEQLKASGITDSSNLNTLAPGLNIRTTVGSFQPYIRGVGTASSVVENPVALFIDGVYYPQQKEGVREFNDIEQIAVLKGPQGTLFGRNSTAGVIQITTRAPGRTWGGDVNLSYANYETVHGDVYLTGPLSNTVAFSLSGAYTHQGKGWGRNIVTGNDTGKLDHQVGGRAKLLWQPDGDTDITLIGDYTDRFQHANAYQAYPGTTFNYVGKRYPDGSLVTLPVHTSVYDTASSFDSTLGFHGGGISLTAERNFGVIKLTSISSWRKGVGSYFFDPSGVAPSLSRNDGPDQKTEDFTQELQFVTQGNGPVTLAGGVYYFWYSSATNNVDRARYFPYPATSATVLVSQSLTSGREVTESLAPFLQGDWKITPGTTLTLGARYTVEKRTLTGSVRTLQPVTTAPPTIARQAPLDASKVTYRAALNQEITNDISAYASFNTGFKSGGFNIVSPTAKGYLPETLTAYEVGLKTRLFDRRLRLNIAAFHYDYSNIQVTQFSPPPVLSQLVSNAAKAKINGLDVDFEARLTSALRISGGFEILDAKFSNYPGAPFNNSGDFTGKVTSVGPVILPDGTLKNARGNRLPLSQKLSANLGADYHVGTSSGDYDFNVTANYNGDYYFEADNFLRQKAYTIVNAQAKYTTPDKRFDVSVWGKNLADAHVITLVSSSGGIGYPASYGMAPRTYGVSVGYHY
ncbi:TonB-dependent receptor [Sphingobium fuliginis]|uniref:TonB-dependent receptor n=1 Tax=Sphingobium fuliginis ATCC 27551 TaxID=1208342 RepID=A0A5B8CLP1_SPHSA|nr:TonB-dependent receptor [Sphingobium fuliginis]QDC39620.1 TonB-dependent receptor [Sphingobium fuliginis ATCC 27551]